MAVPARSSGLSAGRRERSAGLVAVVLRCPLVAELRPIHRQYLTFSAVRFDSMFLAIPRTAVDYVDPLPLHAVCPQWL
jgi:hypothetical protein